MDELNELNARRLVCLHCIRTLAAEKSDPRARDAEDHYRAQLRTIEAKITEITGQPPDVTVGLKTATLTARSER